MLAIAYTSNQNHYRVYMQEDARQCELCNIPIIPQCYDIHRRACERKLKKKENKTKEVPGNLHDLIPCAECGEMVSFSIFALHLDECVGRQLTKCPNCKLLFPTFLIQEHLNVCDQFREEEEPSPTKGTDISDDEEEFEEEEDDDLRNMIMDLAHNAKSKDEPLSLVIIDKMKKKNVERAEECSICYCMISRSGYVFNLSCPHNYHVRCLTAWLQKNPRCPMCRQHVLE